MERILDMIRFTASSLDRFDTFLGHGTMHYWDEAAWLVLEGLHLPVDLDPRFWDALLTESERDQLAALIAKRCLERIPTAYLLNNAWFMGQPFYVDERVLIPRSPFGDLINQDFLGLLETPPTRAVDIGTGSGCIAIALAQHFPQAEVWAADVDFGALVVATENIINYELEERVYPIQSDLLTNLLDHDEQPIKFDLIVSNPPYVDPDEAFDLPEEYHAEPEQALFADNQGMALVEQLLDQASKHLTPQGRIFVEVGNGRAAFERLWPKAKVQWLEFEPNSAEIFTIHANELAQWRGEPAVDL